MPKKQSIIDKIDRNILLMEKFQSAISDVKGRGLVFTSFDLAQNIIEKIPQRILKNPKSTFVDICCGRGTFLLMLKRELLKYHSEKYIVEKMLFGMDILRKNVVLTTKAINPDYKYECNIWQGDSLEEWNEMKFDCVIGNLPFQNSESKSDAGKLYLDLTRKAFDIVKDDGVVSLITPSTLAQEKKTGLTLKGTKGLKLVNYEADNHFSVGVNIIAWMVDRKYSGDITVTDADGTSIKRQPNDILVQEKDKLAFALFEKIKSNKSKMFVGDQSTNGKRQKIKSKEYKYKINVNILKDKVEYSRVKPKLYGRTKIVVHMGMTYNDKNYLVSKEDFGQYQNCIDITDYTKQETQNIKRFLFNDLVIQICKKYRETYKTGMNNIIYSFPPIDVTKKYSQDDIAKHFKLTKKEVKWLLDE